MSTQTSHYQRKYVLEHLLMGADHPSPTNLYLGLFNVEPNPDGSTAEVDAPSYARVEISWELEGDNDDGATNSLVVTFPTAAEDWGSISHWGVFDEETVGDGNLLYFGEADLVRDSEVGTINFIPVGNLHIDASGAEA